MTCKGTVKNGRVEFLPGFQLPEGTPVRIEPLDAEPDPLDGLADEAVTSDITDFASQHDHYIYGTPKTDT